MRNHKGQALVETAIILPLLLLMVFAVIDYARQMYTYNTLINAARSAARAAAVTKPLAPESGTIFPAKNSDSATKKALQKSIFNLIDQDDSLTYILTIKAPDGSPKATAEIDDQVKVAVTWDKFQMWTPFYSMIAFVTGSSSQDGNTKTITGEASMRHE